MCIIYNKKTDRPAIRKNIRFSFWTFPDKSDIVDRYISGFKKVCDHILENKGF